MPSGEMFLVMKDHFVAFPFNLTSLTHRYLHTHILKGTAISSETSKLVLWWFGE